MSHKDIMTNEGPVMRARLDRVGIPTPRLISISDDDLIEEFIEGGDLYSSLASHGPVELAFDAGVLTGRLHKAGWAFIDNKAQNYLVKAPGVLRTDLGFTKKEVSDFSKSMDIGSFLASVMDLGLYPEIEKQFLNGYSSETGRRLSYLSLVIRNLLSLGFSSNSAATLRNMMLDSRPYLES